MKVKIFDLGNFDDASTITASDIKKAKKIKKFTDENLNEIEEYKIRPKKKNNFNQEKSIKK